MDKFLMINDSKRGKQSLSYGFVTADRIII